MWKRDNGSAPRQGDENQAVNKEGKAKDRFGIRMIIRRERGVLNKWLTHLSLGDQPDSSPQIHTDLDGGLICPRSSACGPELMFYHQMCVLIAKAEVVMSLVVISSERTSSCRPWKGRFTESQQHHFSAVFFFFQSVYFHLSQTVSVTHTVPPSQKKRCTFRWWGTNAVSSVHHKSH